MAMGGLFSYASRVTMQGLLRFKPIRWLHRAWLLKRGRVSRTVAGRTVQFAMRRKVDYQFLVGTVAEDEQLKTFIEMIQPTDVVYEIGAHIGSWTMFMADAADQGHVHAFEPDEHNHAACAGNAKLNGFDHVTVHKVAMSDVNGTAQFGVFDRPGDGRHSLIIDEQRHTKVVEVPTVQLDSVPADMGISRPTVLKIDCEGAEVQVLAGGSQTLAGPDLRLIYLELHPDPIRRAGHDPDAVLETIRRHGFAEARRWSQSNVSFHVFQRCS